MWSTCVFSQVHQKGVSYFSSLSLSVVLLPSDPEALCSWWPVSHSKDNPWVLTLGWPVQSLLASRLYLSGSLCLRGLTSEVHILSCGTEGQTPVPPYPS